MRIVRKSTDLLILEDRPRFLAGFVWFMGSACLLAALIGQPDGMGETLLLTALGIATLWIAHQFFPFQRLTFNRQTGQFTRIVARINGRSVTTLPLSEIERAAVQAQWSDNSRMERLALVAGQEKLPLEFGFSPASRGTLVSDINSWMTA